VTLPFPAAWSAIGSVMKRTSLITALLVTVAAAVNARDEHLDTLNVGNDVYKNVTITRVSTTDIYFTHSKGMANVKLKNLTPEMQKHFGFDDAKAKAIEQALHPVYHGRVASATAPAPKTPAEMKLELEDAMTKIKAIVNQPVSQFPLRPEMESELGLYKEGWFHPGANRPDFNTADVGKTAEYNYAKFKYVTSPVNPGVVFLGNELEFNSQKKFFYTDRSVPKKKMTEAENTEINRLYRIIGQNEEALVGK